MPDHNIPRPPPGTGPPTRDEVEDLYDRDWAVQQRTAQLEALIERLERVAATLKRRAARAGYR